MTTFRWEGVLENIKIVTSCYGERFHKLLPAWSLSLRRITEAPISILSLDGLQTLVDVPGVSVIPCPTQEPLEWGSGDLVRLEHVVSNLKNNVTCIQIDLDVYLKTAIDKIIELDYDFIISRAFNFPAQIAKIQGFVLCTGFYIAKPTALSWCQGLYDEIRQLACLQSGTPVLDQKVVNVLLKDVEWKSVEHVDEHWRTKLSVCDFMGTRICVLGAQDIARNGDLTSSHFGIHHSWVTKLFRHPFLARTHRRARLASNMRKMGGIFTRMVPFQWNESRRRATQARRNPLGRRGRPAT
jgi:hypothetical protein